MAAERTKTLTKPRPTSHTRSGSVSVLNASATQAAGPTTQPGPQPQPGPGPAIGPLRFHIQKQDERQYPHLHITMQGLMDNYLQALSQDIPLHHTHINRKTKSRKMKYSNRSTSPLRNLQIKPKEIDTKSEPDSSLAKSQSREVSVVSPDPPPLPKSQSREVSIISSSPPLIATLSERPPSQTSQSSTDRDVFEKDSSSDDESEEISETEEDKDMVDDTVGQKTLRPKFVNKVFDIEPANKAADELLSTEKTYVRGLKMLTNTFIRGLTVFREMEQEVITEEHQKQMFQNISDIFALHHKLYGDLKALRANGPGIGDLLVKLGATLLSYTPFFRMYTAYVNNYEKALEKLKECREKVESFEFYIQYTERVLNIHTQGIESLLITPVQRIPRYILLLKEILKCLEKSEYSKSTDKKALETTQTIEKALSEISKLAVDINESFRLREAREALLGIDQRLRGLDGFILPCDTPVSAKKNGAVSLVTPHRYFVKSGILKKKHKNRLQNFNAWDERYFILLNDLLLYVRTSSKPTDTSPLHLKGVYSLADISVREVAGETKIGRHLNLPSSKEKKTPESKGPEIDPAEVECSFEIQTLDKKLRVRAESKQEKDVWMTQIRSHAVATFTKLQRMMDAKVQAQHKTEMSITRSFSDPTLELDSEPKSKGKELENGKQSSDKKPPMLSRGLSVDLGAESTVGSGIDAFRPRSPSNLGASSVPSFISRTRTTSLEVPSDGEVYRQPPRSPKSLNHPPKNDFRKSTLPRGFSLDVISDSPPPDTLRPKSPKSIASAPASPMPPFLPPFLDTNTLEAPRARSATSPKLPSAVMKYGTLPRGFRKESAEISFSPPQGYGTVRPSSTSVGGDTQKKTSPIAYHFSSRAT